MIKIDKITYFLLLSAVACGALPLAAMEEGASKASPSKAEMRPKKWLASELASAMNTVFLCATYGSKDNYYSAEKLNLAKQLNIPFESTSKGYKFSLTINSSLFSRIASNRLKLMAAGLFMRLNTSLNEFRGECNRANELFGGSVDNHHPLSRAVFKHGLSGYVFEDAAHAEHENDKIYRRTGACYCSLIDGVANTALFRSYLIGLNAMRNILLKNSNSSVWSQYDLGALRLAAEASKKGIGELEINEEMKVLVGEEALKKFAHARQKLSDDIAVIEATMQALRLIIKETNGTIDLGCSSENQTKSLVKPVVVDSTLYVALPKEPKKKVQHKKSKKKHVKKKQLHQKTEEGSEGEDEEKDISGQVGEGKQEIIEQPGDSADAEETVGVRDAKTGYLIKIFKTDVTGRGPLLINPAKINYQDNVLQWFNNPDQALKHARYNKAADSKYVSTIEIKNWTIFMHAFTTEVDALLEKYALQNHEIDNRGNKNTVLVLPVCVVGPKNKEIMGYCEYIFDPQGTCFHRNFTESTGEAMVSKFLDFEQYRAPGIYDMNFPALSETNKNETNKN